MVLPGWAGPLPSSRIAHNGALRQHVRQFIRLHLVMNGHDDRAAAQRRQRADDERASVARPHADALSFAHAQPVKLDAQRLDFAPERLVIQRAAGINDGGAVGPLAGGLGKRVKNVHAAKIKFILTLNS